MGTSTDAILCYGYSITSDPPWMEDDDQDIEKWWQEANGYYADYSGDDKEKHRKTYEAQCAWMKAHPMPTIVWHCSYSEPMFIAAAEESVVVARRGWPEVVTTQAAWDVSEIKKWLDDYGIEYEGPNWYLVSWWG